MTYVKVKNNRVKVRVKQYDLSGEFIAEYESVTDARKAVFAANGSGISNVLDTTNSACGYKWKRA